MSRRYDRGEPPLLPPSAMLAQLRIKIAAMEAAWQAKIAAPELQRLLPMLDAEGLGFIHDEAQRAANAWAAIAATGAATTRRAAGRLSVV